MRITGTLLITFLAAQSNVFAQQPASADKPAVTILTGCLRSSGADTAIAGPSGRLYTLEVIEPPAKPEATTTTGSTPPVASKTTYSLSAAESLGLEKHADHEVQLTGTLQTPATTGTGTGTGKPGTTTSAPQPKPGGAHRTFEVTALKMVAPKCK